MASDTKGLWELPAVEVVVEDTHCKSSGLRTEQLRALVSLFRSKLRFFIRTIDIIARAPGACEESRPCSHLRSLPWKSSLHVSNEKMKTVLSGVSSMYNIDMIHNKVL